VKRPSLDCVGLVFHGCHSPATLSRPVCQRPSCTSVTGDRQCRMSWRELTQANERSTDTADRVPVAFSVYSHIITFTWPRIWCSLLVCATWSVTVLRGDNPALPPTVSTASTKRSLWAISFKAKAKAQDGSLELTPAILPWSRKWTWPMILTIKPHHLWTCQHQYYCVLWFV